MTNATKKPRLTKAQRLARLAVDTSGNMMLIMAAAFIPITAMVGSAFDMGRAYMVKTRLQQACDAGALAGRRAMTTAVFDATAEEQANHFFDSNFPDGSFATTDVEFNPRGTSDGQVEADASVVVPMTLMRLFKEPSMTITVECEAILEIANTDIMFVLDITGSMNCSAADTPSTCSNNGNVEKTNARIKALRTAVVDFYDTLDTAISNEARLRIGFVPYSSTVNAGDILPSGYISDVSDYQTRKANFNTPYYTGTDGAATETNEVEYFSRSSSCNDWADNYGNNPVVSGTPPSNTTKTTYSKVSYNSSSDKCTRKKSVVTTTNYKLKGYKFTSWTYDKFEIDTSSFKTGSSVQIATSISSDAVVPTSGLYDPVKLAALADTTGITKNSYSWNRCIQERDTVAQASFSTIPGEAYDLDIDLTPSSKATRWKPLWVQLMYNRNTGKDTDEDGVANAETSTSISRSNIGTSSVSCGKGAQKLKEMTHDDVSNYVYASDFKAIGSTYHDFGMIWGARLISPTGIFGSENATAPNGKPISRHIIFLTDGQMQPSSTVYGMQGYERLDQRVTGGPHDYDELEDRHNARFSAICEAIKDKNITIWVVAYATGLSTRLEDCADPGRAFTAENDEDLQDQFKTIAGKIAELRLKR